MPTLRSKNEPIFFFNFQKMFAQLVIYLDLSKISNHSCNNYKDNKNWSREQLLLYSPFKNYKDS
jgi:hypothetical protein